VGAVAQCRPPPHFDSADEYDAVVAMMQDAAP
jgi:hypothetical protein